MSATGIRPRSAAASSGAPASHAGRLRRVIGSAWRPCGPSTMTSCGARPSGAPTCTTSGRAQSPSGGTTCRMGSRCCAAAPRVLSTPPPASSRAPVSRASAGGSLRNSMASCSTKPDAPRPNPAARTRVRAELGTPPDARLLCYVGRKAPNKGLDVLLRAFERIQAPDRLLVVAGPSTAWYDRLLAEARGGRIIDLPALSEPAKFDLLAAADVLVLPSRHESFGTVFLEAWAVGTPVIGADVNAVRQVIGDAGLTFRPDDADDLAARIGSLLGSSGLRRALAERGRREVTRHTWDRLGTTIMAAYEATRPAERGEVAR